MNVKRIAQNSCVTTRLSDMCKEATAWGDLSEK